MSNIFTSSSENVVKAAFVKWFVPLIKALKDLNGSATPQEVRQKIIENEKLSEDDISQTRGRNNVNKFKNEVDFARDYLKKSGYIDGSERGIWTLSEAGKTVEMTQELAESIYKRVRKIICNKDKFNNSDDVLTDKNIEKVQYWLYSLGNNAERWEEFYNNGIMAIGWDEIGDLSAYDSKEAMKQAMKNEIDPTPSYTMAGHATWQFANDMNIGDIVFVKKGLHGIIGRGVVESDYIFDQTRGDFKNIRKVKWTHKGDWEHPNRTTMKTLTDITPYTEDVEKLKALFDFDEEVSDKEEIEYPIYDEAKFLQEVYMDKTQYDILTELIRTKKNVILQGAPGVGKTFVAKRLAYSMMGVMDKERVMMVQFHQSYSYEDFIMGFRPTETGFTLKKGAFYDFCKTAEIDSEKDYFFIIDEINRGNLSKIFGELFMLIENDKRGVELNLLYSDEKFSIPENIYIIGMMNTADRSLAIMDYALRRRFAFFDIKPGFKTEGFRDYKESLNSTKFNNLINCVEDLNDVIKNDESLGEGFCIGHSYFCNLKEISDQRLKGIVDYELVPLLKEYWFDEPSKTNDWTNRLRNSIK